MSNKLMANAGCLGLVLLLVVVTFFTAVVTVDAGETCAITTWGEVTGEASAGLHFRWPLVQRFHCFSTRGVVYEASDHPNESQADYTDFTVEAQTNDGQQLAITYGVRFFVPAENVESVYRGVGQNMTEVVERVVKFHSRSVVRLTMQEYAAGRLYTGDVFAVEAEISSRLKELFASRGVIMDSFVLRKIDFDDDFVQAIENQQIAKENIETAQFQAQAAEHEADRIAIIARGTADGVIEAARGEAERTRIQADAEAYSISVRGEALKKFPELVQWQFVNNLPTTTWMILPDTGITPLIPLPVE